MSRGHREGRGGSRRSSLILQTPGKGRVGNRPGASTADSAGGRQGVSGTAPGCRQEGEEGRISHPRGERGFEGEVVLARDLDHHRKDTGDFLTARDLGHRRGGTGPTNLSLMAG